jgi:hypothetical protein
MPPKEAETTNAACLASCVRLTAQTRSIPALPERTLDAPFALLLSIRLPI